MIISCKDCDQTIKCDESLNSSQRTRFRRDRAIRRFGESQLWEAGWRRLYLTNESDNDPANGWRCPVCVERWAIIVNEQRGVLQHEGINAFMIAGLAIAVVIVVPVSMGIVWALA
jgi:hypothetical protein